MPHHRANKGQSQNSVLVLSDPTVQALSADAVLPTRVGACQEIDNTLTLVTGRQLYERTTPQGYGQCSSQG